MRRAQDNSEEQLPADESGYETPAAVVYQRSGPWFRIALQQGSAWITRDTSNGFLSYPELIEGTPDLSEKRVGWEAVGRPGGEAPPSHSRPIGSLTPRTIFRFSFSVPVAFPVDYGYTSV